MKTSLIAFKKIEEELDSGLFKGLSFALSDVLDLDTISILNFNDELAFSRRIEEAETYAENLIILAPDFAENKVKTAIAEKLGLELVVNENALNLLREKKGNNLLEEDGLLPFGATLIPNFLGETQGYMIENMGFTLLVLPEKLNELLAAVDNYVIPYFKLKTGLKTEKWQFKFFGETKELNNSLLSLQKNFGEVFNYYYQVIGCDHSVSIIFLDGTDKAEVQNIKRQITLALKEGLYADYLTTLSERLFDLLRLRKLKLSVAESFTGGRIVSSLIENSGISEYLMEGAVTYSNLSKVKRLGVREEDIIKLGAVSSKVAYEMAAGLLTGGNCDMAIATTGIAGPKSEDTVKPVGLAFIAVGDKKGVHVYKYNFTGDREEITETAKNTALFLAIKKLKNV
ncbi:MAG: nicotinamide-nucleotide amidohydrolase family protein [Clostridia bacterium]|nr:nicotinamide-nucleotide amidohydrolase family protein [Clostridia bacterium]